MKDPNSQIIPEFQKSRTSVLHRFPFFGNILLGLKTYKDSSIPTMMTDGTSLKYNPEYFRSLTKEQRSFILLHETMHLACLHHTRIPKNCNFDIFNVAADYIVNGLINDLEGIRLIPDALFEPAYKKMTVEQLYKILMKEYGQDLGGEDLGGEESEAEESEAGSDSGSGSDNNPNGEEDKDDTDDPTDNNTDTASDDNDDNTDSNDNNNGEVSDAQDKEKETSKESEERKQKQQEAQEKKEKKQNLIDKAEKTGLVTQTTQDTREAEQQTINEMTLNKRMIDKSNQTSGRNKSRIPEALAKQIENRIQIGLPWQSILSDFFSNNAQSDYNWIEPDPSYQTTGCIMPSLISESLTEFAIAIDTSGSIDKKQLEIFITEAKAILEDIEYSKVYLIYCSHEVEHFDTFTKEDDITTIDTPGGGTSFNPVMNLIESQGWNLSGLIYFTDLQCFETFIEPECPVLWSVFNYQWFDEVHDTSFLPQFGEIVKMEI